MTLPPAGAGLAAPLEAGIQRFLAHLADERRCAQCTVRSYGSDLHQFARFLYPRIADPRLPLAAVQPQHVAEFVSQLQRRGLRPSSQARKVSALRACFRYLTFQGWVAANPVIVPTLPATDDRPPAVIDREAMDQALTPPLLAAFRDHRDYAILSVLYGGGLRLGELVGLNLSSVDLERQTARVTGPAGQQRVVPLGAAAVAALRSYLRQRAELMVGLDIGRVDVGALFVNRRGRRLERRTVQRLVARQLGAVGVGRRCSPGTVRHTYAAHMVAAGANPAAVNRLLGRGGPGAVAAPSATPLARLRQVYAQAHPRAGAPRPAEAAALASLRADELPAVPGLDPWLT